MIPDYDSFEDFTPGFDEQLADVPDDEDFSTVDREPNEEDMLDCEED